MPNFTDSKSRSWRIELDGGLARRLKQEEQLDFFNLGNGQAFAALAQSEEKVIDALWLCCEAQAQQQGIDPVEFAYGFASGEIFESAHEALIEAGILFTRPAMRPAIEAVRTKAREAIAAGVDVVQARLNGTKGQEMLATARRKAEEKFDATVQQLTASGSSTSGPASSASIPRT